MKAFIDVIIYSSETFLHIVLQYVVFRIGTSGTSQKNIYIFNQIEMGKTDIIEPNAGCVANICYCLLSIVEL